MDWNPPDDLDQECLTLCCAMNGVLGIHTVSSCSGHGKEPFRIWFQAEDIDDLPALLYWLDACHCGFSNWQVRVQTDCSFSPATFCLEGPKGRRGQSEAEAIARFIETGSGLGAQEHLVVPSGAAPAAPDSLPPSETPRRDETSPIEHELRCHPPFFAAVANGSKPFEARRADRPFAVGDTLFLREWDPIGGEYTSRECRRRISYILPGGEWGIEKGHCVLGLQSSQTEDNDGAS